MTQSATFRRFKRRIGQITRRATTGPHLQVRQLSAEVMNLLNDLRRAADDEPEIAIELALSLLETLPALFLKLDDRLGLLGGALDHVPALLTDLLHDDLDNPASVVDRFDVFERVFCLWVGDDSGYLQTLDETLLTCLTNREDEDVLLRICQDHLRHLPLVFPAAGGDKLDLERSILQADRHRVERLLGEVHAVRGRFEYSIIVARAHYRATSDAVDFVSCLARAGLEDEAIEVAKRALRHPTAPRRAAVKDLYETIVARRAGHRKLHKARLAEFTRHPSLDAWQALRESTAEGDWTEERARHLGELEARGAHNELTLDLYLHEGMIVEADGLVVNRPVDPHHLAECADRILEDHTDRAAGWLLIATHHLMKTARPAQYRQAASWLLTIRRASEATGQMTGFERMLADFKAKYRRRRALLRILDEHGL